MLARRRRGDLRQRLHAHDARRAQGRASDAFPSVSEYRLDHSRPLRWMVASTVSHQRLRACCRRDYQICDSHAPAISRGDVVVAVPLPPGGLVLFDGMLPHGTAASRAERSRLGFGRNRWRTTRVSGVRRMQARKGLAPLWPHYLRRLDEVVLRSVSHGELYPSPLPLSCSTSVRRPYFLMRGGPAQPVDP